MTIGCSTPSARSPSPSLSLSRSLLVPCLAALLAGCVKPDRVVRFTPAWEPFDPTEEGWTRTRKVLLVSDTQVHNVYSMALPERDLTAESMAATAIRPPQLDLFSGDVLEWVIRNAGKDTDVVLHLGDAVDLACEGELADFFGVMERGGKPWFLAPGNHDFYYFGTYDAQDLELWDLACHGSGARLPKDRFIRLYVAALLRQQDPGCAALAGALGLTGDGAEPLERTALRIPAEFDWEARPEDPGLLEAIAWKLDEARPWRSFIMQRVDVTLPRTDGVSFRVLLLDSCQYAERPGLIPNAWRSYPLQLNCGFTGEMLPDQLRKVRSWLEAGGPSANNTLMFHHPFRDLAPRTRSSLGWLWREVGIGVVVTGHTHSGFFEHHDVGGEFDELELNIGSTTDWPMEWRTLGGYGNLAEKKMYIRSERSTLVETLQNEKGYFEREWEVPVGAPDDYRQYQQGEAEHVLLVDFYLVHHLVPYWLPQPRIRPGAAARRTEDQVKDTLLFTYRRLLEAFPTDPSAGAPRWPAGTGDDGAVLRRIGNIVGSDAGLEAKAALLAELQAFERSRRCLDRRTGLPGDDARLRYKLSQAAWASRFEAERGRSLRIEDEVIRVDWEKAERRARGLTGKGL